jgi:hypothetical protein
LDLISFLFTILKLFLFFDIFNIILTEDFKFILAANFHTKKHKFALIYLKTTNLLYKLTCFYYYKSNCNNVAENYKNIEALEIPTSLIDIFTTKSHMFFSSWMSFSLPSYLTLHLTVLILGVYIRTEKERQEKKNSRLKEPHKIFSLCILRFNCSWIHENHKNEREIHKKKSRES